MEVLMKLNDLLTMPQLRTTILNMTPLPKAMKQIGKDVKWNDCDKPNATGTHYRKTSCSSRGGYLRNHTHRHNRRWRVRRERITERYKEEVGTTYVMATYISTIHCRSAQDQAFRVPNGATCNHQDTAILVRFHGHPNKEKRVWCHPQTGMAGTGEGETWLEVEYFVHRRRRSKICNLLTHRW